MNKQSILRALKIGLILVAVVTLVELAFVAGYTSGRNAASPTPVAEQAYEFEDEPIRPTATPEAAAQEDEPSPPPTPTRPSPVEDGAMDLYWEVWEIVERDYYGDLPSEQERGYGAIRGSIDTLSDDYTSFIEADAAEILRNDMSGSFEGIGAVVRMNDRDQLEIVRPLDDQPAQEAGIKAGDIILEVDGIPLEGMGIYEAISYIRGPKGTPVVLTILRPGEDQLLEVEIIRQRIPLPTVEYEMLPDNVGYVHLYDFNAQATDKLRAALEVLLDRGASAIVLDLRDNPGGYLSQAVEVADEFLPPGTILYERSANDAEQIFKSTDRGLADEVPLAVLINAGSASASEIVAGAIQDRERAPLIGEISFGKGSVQAAHALSDGSELRLTIALWYTPSEQPLHGQGLVPDYTVIPTEQDLEADRDPQLEQAIQVLLDGE